MEAHYSVLLNSQPDVIFDHLVDPELLVAWWPTGAETNPEEGGTYHLWWDGPGWHLRGEYTRVDPPNSLSFTWKWDHGDVPPRSVEVSLSSEGSATELSITHEAGDAEEMKGYLEGWEFFLSRLAVHLTDL